MNEGNSQILMFESILFILKIKTENLCQLPFPEH